MNGSAVLDPGARPRLDVGVQRLVGLVEVSLDGTLDEDGVDALRTDLEALLADGANTIDVDCTELDDVDGFGLALLLDVHRSLDRRGGRLVLRYACHDVVARIRRAGLVDVLSVPD